LSDDSSIKPLDLVALNYFFDTLLFSGAVLVLADALREQTAAGQLAPELPVSNSFAESD